MTFLEGAIGSLGLGKTMTIMTPIRHAQSSAIDEEEAVREFFAGVEQPDMTLVVFFCSSKYDLRVIAAEMKRLFGHTQVVGCTTAGEIGPLGCREHSITGASLQSPAFFATTGLIKHLQDFRMSSGATLVQDLLQRLESQAPQANSDNSFAFMMIDGLSKREEPVTYSLQNALGEVPLVGGSAGDDMAFTSTLVYFDGAFHPESAVIMLVTTSLPFRVFKTQHFMTTDRRVVVTSAVAEKRVVREIDGRPAAEVYAELLGVDVPNLDPMHFPSHPVVVVIDGTNYVRAIQKANPDGSLTFFCAIEEGVVLREARGEDLVEDLERAFAGIQAEIGPPQLVFCCDCLLRRLETSQGGFTERVSSIFRDNNVVGFNSYGEQYRGIHVNQTLTGVAFGAEAESNA